MQGCSGVAGGVKGAECPLLTAKSLPKNQEIEGENQEKAGKEGKIGEKEEKSWKFFHFAPPDR